MDGDIYFSVGLMYVGTCLNCKGSGRVPFISRVISVNTDCLDQGRKGFTRRGVDVRGVAIGGPDPLVRKYGLISVRFIGLFQPQNSYFRIRVHIDGFLLLPFFVSRCAYI